MIGLDRLAEAPAGLPLLLKATLVLAAAWLVHAALMRANPRWRVLTWRCAAAGLAAVAALALAPPLATWRVPAPRSEPRPASRPIPIVEPIAAPVVEVEPTPVATAVPVESLAPVSKPVVSRPKTHPRPKPAAPPAEPIAWAFWLGIAWLTGVAVGLARWAVGSIRLGRIARGGSEPPSAVLEVCRATAEALGVRRRVRAVVSPAVASPCIAGVWRPTILLPAGMGLDAPGPDLDAVLVHELTHVHNGDLAWNGLLNLAGVALWFHPFAWRIRSVHAAACDAVCDAAAVDRLGDVATYARALARLALKATPPAGGLAMARACDIRRRVEALQRMVYRSPLSRRLAVPAILLSTALAVLIGGAAVTRARDEPAKPPATADKDRDFRSGGGASAQASTPEPRAGVEGVVLLPDGRPATGADVALETPDVLTALKGDRIEQSNETPIHKTGEDGRFRLPRPEGTVVVVAAHREGFALASLEDLGDPPALRLRPWARIEGRVMVGKRPGAGEEVTFQPHPGHMPQAMMTMRDYGAVTKADEEGRFVMDKVVPFPGYIGRAVVTDLGEGSTSYAPVGMKAADVKSGATIHVTIGGDGRPVVGRVALDGRPDVAVAWARNEPARIVRVPGILEPGWAVRFWFDRSLLVGGSLEAAPRYAGEFDAEGRFRADDVPPGSYRLTVDVVAPVKPGSRRDPETLAHGVLNFKVPPGDIETPVDVGEVVAKLERPPAVGDEPTKPAAAATGALVVRVLDDATGGPVEGAEVESSFVDIKVDKSIKAAATTGADGTARVEHDAGARVGNLSLIVRKPGYVPGSFHRGRGGSVEPFPMPEAKEFRLVRGTELGGVAVDEAGAPVAGATVKVSAPFADSDFPLMYFDVATLTTDAEGRWRTANAPEALGDVHASVAHPDYRGTSVKADRGDLRAILVKGETVSGRVIDGDGGPIEGAKVKLRDGPSSTGTADATTDAEGRFTIPHAKPGDFYVMAEADGHAPAFQDVKVERGIDAEGVELTMGPGETIRLRVVDAEGRPLPDVAVAPSLARGREWGSSFRAKTDAEGRAVWRDAPADETTYTFSRRGLMAVRTALAPGDEERVVVMRPPLVVSGAVVDAVTKRTVPRFQVERGVIGEGRDRPFWQSDATDATDGRYSRTFDYPQTWAIRIIAPGYETAESPGFQVDDPGAATRDFALKPRAWLQGVVRRPDGAPDPRARVVLLTTSNRGASLDGTTFAKGYGAPAQEADAEGRYAFPPPEPPFLLVATSESGYVEAKPEDVAKSPDLTLRAWGRIEGTARIGDEPAAGAWVEFQPDRDGGPGERDLVRVYKSVSAQADAQGRYVLEHVVPGPGKVGRMLVSRDGNRRYPVGMEPVDVEPGATTRIDVGGGGRPVVGRATYDGPVDWLHNRAALLRTELGALDIPAAEYKLYVGEYDGNGRFRIEDVPPGRYRLALRADVQLPVSHPTPAMAPGRTSRSIVVPEGDSTAPVDVGEVALRPERRLKPGDPAPALDLERIDAAGGRFVLGDQRGKVVALCFWTSWLKSVPSLPSKLQELQKEREGDPRFELVGVSLDDAPADAARFVRENGMPGIQAFGGPIGAGAAADFGDDVPAPVVLVGPDGRIIAPFVAWDNLREEVAKALAAMEPSAIR